MIVLQALRHVSAQRNIVSKEYCLGGNGSWLLLHQLATVPVPPGDVSKSQLESGKGGVAERHI